jgi:hypothetical protein
MKLPNSKKNGSEVLTGAVMKIFNFCDKTPRSLLKVLFSVGFMLISYLAFFTTLNKEAG